MTQTWKGESRSICIAAKIRSIPVSPSINRGTPKKSRKMSLEHVQYCICHIMMPIKAGSSLILSSHRSANLLYLSRQEKRKKNLSRQLVSLLLLSDVQWWNRLLFTVLLFPQDKIPKGKELWISRLHFWEKVTLQKKNNNNPSKLGWCNNITKSNCQNNDRKSGCENLSLLHVRYRLVWISDRIDCRHQTGLKWRFRKHWSLVSNPSFLTGIYIDSEPANRGSAPWIGRELKHHIRQR